MQYPPEQKIEMPFFRTGAINSEKLDATGWVRRPKPRVAGPTKVEVKMKDEPAPPSVKPEYQAYVLWAVTEKGEFVKLGAIGGKLETETQEKAFGMVISLEADPNTAQPKGPFVLESGLPDKKTRYFGMVRVYYDKK